jgi:ADP-heptose:LPS heptosyltransferase
MPKILIIRFSPLSGIINSSLLVRCLKKQLPACEIHYTTYDKYLPAIAHNPYITRYFLLAHSHELLLEELKAEEYDYVIDLENNSFSHSLCDLFPGAKKCFTPAGNRFAGSVYRLTGIDLFPRMHEAKHFLHTIRSLEVKDDGAGLEYFISQGDETRKDDVPASHHAGFISCVIGHGEEMEGGQWPVDKWKEFCKVIDHPVILIGEKANAALAQEIRSPDPVKIYSACGKFSLNEMADLIRKSKLVAGTSSSWIQLAAAYKRPVVWWNDGKLPSRWNAPFYGERFVNSRAKPNIITKKRNDSVGDVIQSVYSLL